VVNPEIELIMLATCDMYKVNNSGPRLESWGTPYSQSVLGDCFCPARTNCVLPLYLVVSSFASKTNDIKTSLKVIDDFNELVDLDQIQHSLYLRPYFMNSAETFF